MCGGGRDAVSKDKEKVWGSWGRILYFPRKHAMRRHDVYLTLLVSYLLQYIDIISSPTFLISHILFHNSIYLI